MAVPTDARHIRRPPSLPITPELSTVTSARSKPSLPRSTSSGSDVRLNAPALSLHPPSENPDSQLSSSLPVSGPLGPPPSAPLPDLPPFPSPIAPGTITTLLRGPNAERRTSQHIAGAVSRPPTSPAYRSTTADSLRATSVGGPPPPISHSLSRSAGVSRSRPMSASSFSSHLSAASEALSQSIMSLDREADALGILTSSLRSTPSKNSSKRHGGRRSASYNLSVVTSQEPLGSESASPGPKITNPSTRRKSSLRILKPLPNLPSPQEKEETEFPSISQKSPGSRTPSPDIREMLGSISRPRSRSRSRTRASSLHSSQSKSSLASRPSQGQLTRPRGTLTRFIPPIEMMPNARLPHVSPKHLHSAPKNPFFATLYSSDEEPKSQESNVVPILSALPQDCGASSTTTSGWITPMSGSESESSIDLHTPLPQLLVHKGLLSPTSTVVRSMGSENSPRKPTDLRKRRHRDGKLLREGVGLTTGLGWSDSEDEDAPGPLRRRISNMLLRKSNTTVPIVESASAPVVSASLGMFPSAIMTSLSSRSSLTSRTSSLWEGVIDSPQRPPFEPLPITPDVTPDSSTNSVDTKLSMTRDGDVLPTATELVPSVRKKSSIPLPFGIPSSSSAPHESARSNGDDDNLSAAEAAYRASKDLTQSIKHISRVGSSQSSRDSMMSTSSGVTEFGVLRTHRSLSGPSAPPPSAFHFPPNANNRSISQPNENTLTLTSDSPGDSEPLAHTANTRSITSPPITTGESATASLEYTSEINPANAQARQIRQPPRRLILRPSLPLITTRSLHLGSTGGSLVPISQHSNSSDSNRQAATGVSPHPAPTQNLTSAQSGAVRSPPKRSLPRRPSAMLVNGP